jgi:hypothetical protein
MPCETFSRHPMSCEETRPGTGSLVPAPASWSAGPLSRCARRPVCLWPVAERTRRGAFLPERAAEDCRTPQPGGHTPTLPMNLRWVGRPVPRPPPARRGLRALPPRIDSWTQCAISRSWRLSMNRTAAFRRQKRGKSCWRVRCHAKSASSRFCRINAAIQGRAGSSPRFASKFLRSPLPMNPASGRLSGCSGALPRATRNCPCTA